MPMRSMRSSISRLNAMISYIFIIFASLTYMQQIERSTWSLEVSSPAIRVERCVVCKSEDMQRLGTFYPRDMMKSRSWSLLLERQSGRPSVPAAESAGFWDNFDCHQFHPAEKGHCPEELFPEMSSTILVSSCSNISAVPK